MASPFTWIPSTNYKKGTAPRHRSVKFGGGYSQRLPDSFNNLDVTWTLTFQNRPYDEADNLLAFLEDKRGTEAFLFTPPDETQTSHKVICKQWDSVATSVITKTISCTFEKVYE